MGLVAVSGSGGGVLLIFPTSRTLSISMIIAMPYVVKKLSIGFLRVDNLNGSKRPIVGACSDVKPKAVTRPDYLSDAILEAAQLNFFNRPDLFD